MAAKFEIGAPLAVAAFNLGEIDPMPEAKKPDF
jgi:hypothetical protein